MRKKNTRVPALLLALALLLTLAPAALAEQTPEPEEAAESTEVREQIHPLPTLYLLNCSTQEPLYYRSLTLRLEDEYGQVLLLDEQAQFRVRGNSTLRAAKKPYKLKLSAAADLLGMGEQRKWVLLANALDKSLLRNKLMYDLGQAMGLKYTPEGRFVDVYFGNRLLGNYLLTESIEVEKNRLDLSMASNEFGFELCQGHRLPGGEYLITPDYGLRLELTDCHYLPQDQRDWLMDFFTRAEAALRSGERAEIENFFDLDSFLDVYIINELSKNPDTAMASTRFYLEDGKLLAGPLWDYDLSCGDDNENCDRDHYYNDTIPCATDGWYACSLWWETLVRLDWFQELFRARYRELQPVLVNLYADNELGQNRIDALIEPMAESIEANYRRWPVTLRWTGLERYPEYTYEENVDYLRGWLKARNEWILSQLEPGGPIRFFAED